jgi:hypothetical protein
MLEGLLSISSRKRIEGAYPIGAPPTGLIDCSDISASNRACRDS